MADRFIFFEVGFVMNRHGWKLEVLKKKKEKSPVEQFHIEFFLKKSTKCLMGYREKYRGEVQRRSEMGEDEMTHVYDI